MSLNNNHPDLEPLIESSSPSAATASSAKWRFNKKTKLSGLILRRRDPKGYQEKCGRARLLAILGAFAFVLIYLSNLKPYQHMVVRIPEDDKNLPGPKSMFHVLCFACFGFL